MADQPVICCEVDGCIRTFGSLEGRAMHERLMHSEAVPDAALGLPWIRWPSELAACDGTLERIEQALTHATGDSERAFWDSLRLAIADRGARSRLQQDDSHGLSKPLRRVRSPRLVQHT